MEPATRSAACRTHRVNASWCLVRSALVALATMSFQPFGGAALVEAGCTALASIGRREAGPCRATALGQGCGPDVNGGACAGFLIRNSLRGGTPREGSIPRKYASCTDAARCAGSPQDDLTAGPKAVCVKLKNVGWPSAIMTNRSPTFSGTGLLLAKGNRTLTETMWRRHARRAELSYLGMELDLSDFKRLEEGGHKTARAEFHPFRVSAAHFLFDRPARGSKSCSWRSLWKCVRRTFRLICLASI